MKSRLSVRVRGIAAVLSAGVVVIAGVSTTVPASAAPLGILDQSAVSGGSSTGEVSTDGQWISQSFTAGISGGLVQVDVDLNLQAPPTFITVSIKAADGSGSPTGAALASSVVSSSALPSGLLSVNFGNPVTVVANAQYAIVLTCTGCGVSTGGGPMSPRTRIGWKMSTATYAGGKADNSCCTPSWGGGGMDLAFATYVGTASLAASSSEPLPPPPADISQSVGMPASGNCNVIDDKSLNWAGATSGSWTPSWAAWTNGGKGGVVCNRFLRYNAKTTTWFSVSQ